MTQYRNLFCDEDAQVTGLDLEKMATALARSRVRVLNEPTQSLSSHTTISNDIGIERQELNVSDNAVVKITDNSSMLKLIEDRAVIIKSEVTYLCYKLTTHSIK